MGVLIGLLCRRTAFLFLSSLIGLSFLAPSRVSCQFEDFSESAGKFMRSVKDSVSGNLGPALKKVTKTASDALDVAAKTVSEALGPDLSKGGRESCPREGCPDDGGQENQGFRPPTSSSKDEDEKNELARISEAEPGLLKMLWGSASTGLATVGRTLYDTMSDMTTRFAETVRTIMSEEFYDLMVGSMKKVRKVIFTPGSTLYYLGESAASVSLALSCLLLSYIFLRFFSFFNVLAFLSAMFLLHQVLGPVRLYDWIFWVGGYFLEVAWFMTKHYYVTSVLTVLIFGYSTVMVVIRWSTQRSERQQRDELRVLVGDISARLNALPKDVTLKKLQEDVNTRLKCIEDTQKEMMTMLRQLLKEPANPVTSEQQH